MAGRKAKALVDRVHGLKDQKHLKFEVKPEEELDIKIRVIDTQISNCEGDLKGHFHGCIAIENKLRLLKLRRLELDEERAKLIPDKIITSEENLE